jgi:replicative DNA helicase
MKPDLSAKLLHLLNPEDFYQSRNRILYHTIRLLWNEKKPFDIIMVSERLKAEKQVNEISAYDLTGFVDKVPSSANAMYYAKMVKDLANRRKLQQIGNEITIRQEDPQLSIQEIVGKAEQDFQLIIDHSLEGEVNFLTIEQLDETLKDEPGITYLIDDLIPSDAIILLNGSPGSYKTTFAMCIANAVGSGTDLSGMIVQNGKVLYIDSENPQSKYGEYRSQIKKMKKSRSFLNI